MKEKKEKLPKRWVACPIEEQYFGEGRKEGKKLRKRAEAKDRSQYKKTDRDKKLEAFLPENADQLKRGRVVSISAQGIMVNDNMRIICCSLKGSLKKDKTQFKSLIIVGDYVLFEEVGNNEGIISHIETRKSVLSRADNLSRRKQQLIASNVDQVLIIASVVSPSLKPSLIDRYIIAANKGNLEPIIVINKIDLLENWSQDKVLADSEREKMELLLDAFAKTKIKIIPISTQTGEGLDLLRKAMHNKTSVFSGQSGVGKTSLINITAGFDLRVGDVVDRTQKGSHTTTSATLLELPFGGWCIDTPGIKSFGVWDLDKNEIQQHFTEIFEAGLTCHYPGCTHTGEPGCTIPDLVEEGKISMLRYQSYLDLLEEANQEHKRR